jgi:hypothetical protein
VEEIMKRIVPAAVLAVVGAASAGAQQFDPAPGVPIKTEAMARAESAAPSAKAAEMAARPLTSSQPARRAGVAASPRPAAPPKQ